MSLNHHHFGIFIGLSLALHAAVLTVIQMDNIASMGERNNASLDIELLAKPDTAKKLQPQHARQKKAAVTSYVAVTEQSVIETAAGDTSEAGHSDNHDTPAIITEGTVSQKISIEFLRYFYYPDAARRRNWQGDVVLQFNLLPDGHLDQIRIHQSSGYKSLDEAAVHALQQVTPQLELASLTDSGILHILPVSYRLTNPL